MMPTLKLVYGSESETEAIPMTIGPVAPEPAARTGRLVGIDSVVEVERSLENVESSLDRLDELARQTFRFDRGDDGPTAA